MLTVREILDVCEARQCGSLPLAVGDGRRLRSATYWSAVAVAYAVGSGREPLGFCGSFDGRGDFVAWMADAARRLCDGLRDREEGYVPSVGEAWAVVRPLAVGRSVDWLSAVGSAVSVS